MIQKIWTLSAKFLHVFRFAKINLIRAQNQKNVYPHFLLMWLEKNIVVDIYHYPKPSLFAGALNVQKKSWYKEFIKEEKPANDEMAPSLDDLFHYSLPPRKLKLWFWGLCM